MITVLSIILLSRLIKAQNTNVMKVPVDIYISERGKDSYSVRMEDIETAMNKVKEKLENNLNQRALSDATNKYSPIEFSINVLTEPPKGIDIDECGQNIDIIATHLQAIHNMNTKNNIITFLNCPSSTYYEHFSNANMEVPLLIQGDNLSCVRRIATFVEPERSKFELTFANALMAAAGCPIKNPVSLKEDDGGDRGVQTTYFLESNAYELLFREACDQIP
ncbi:spore wall protein [Vairimorpha necatrix]|uniref:Spore wall protein n=1 Tax=Vairimorpha necatrix TaxID=6039 RepID=A0AAX4JCP7_9MICR